MKITQVHLDDFGIYHHISWQPPETGLIVMHGQNESGKTTFMKYVRSMFFGYLRGDWRGYFGHMDIRREDGHEYTIYRNEKESYIKDGDETIREEPADLWWHSLERETYDKIFAMGLEDLQGFKILSNDAVRSHFFSMESGVRIGLTRQALQQDMGNLFVASAQGKKPINMLLHEQKEFDQKIRGMAYDETEFADLQAKERSTHEMENRIRLEIEETKQQIDKISMPIAAWEVYKRGQDALQRMQALADVAQFPLDGAQQWTELDKNVKDLSRQIKALEDTARKGPAFQQEWNRWLVGGEQFDELYQHIAEWKQYIDELKTQEDMEMDWQFEQNKQAELLKPWLDGPIPQTVDWHKGAMITADLQRNHEAVEKWSAEKPKDVSPAAEQDGDEPERTQAEWEQIGKAVADIQATIMERQKVEEQLSWLENQPVQTSHAFLYISILFFIGAAAVFWLVYAQYLDLPIGLGGALACAVLGVICYIKQGAGADGIPKKIDELQGQLAVIQAKLEDGAEAAHIDLSVQENNDVWTQKLDDIRKNYLDWKTAETKNAWAKEQKVMYDAIYDKWNTEGKRWQQQVAASEAAWQAWKETTRFQKLTPADVNQAQTVWEAWQAVTTKLEQWQERKKRLIQQVTVWHDTAEQLFREVGVTAAAVPEQLEQVYKQWQEIRVQAEVAKEQDKQAAARREQIARLKRERDMSEQKQKLLLTSTGAQTEGEFRSKLLKFRQFQQYKEVFDQSEAHLRLIAKTPKQLAELRHELKIHDIKNWTDERAYYEKKIADAEKKLNEVAEKRGSIIERLSQMAKSDEYGRLLQQKQNRKAELDRVVNEWLADVFTQHMLGEAQEYYERVRQPVVIKTAGEYLQLMTQGRYTLQASFDGRQLYAVDGSQRRIPEKQWSSGLGDQIYLAIRISLAMAFSKQIEPMPLILDDILVRFDETRQKEALRFLASLGKTEQVLLFTCSEATRNLAKEVQQELAGETDTIHLFEIEKGTIKAG